MLFNLQRIIDKSPQFIDDIKSNPKIVKIAIRYQFEKRWKNARNNTLVFFARLLDKQLVHILHIGKTGGTAITYALKKHLWGKKNVIIPHLHHVTLMDIPQGEKVFFVLRDPVNRFVSSFNDRKRKGLKRYYAAWSKQEQRAFEFFLSPNDLALSLSPVQLNEEAVQAMGNIYHVNQHFRIWLESTDYLLSRRDDILLIGYQENLDNDFQTLINTLGLPESVKLPIVSLRSHKAPRAMGNTRLDKISIKNLKAFYSEDYLILKFCQENFSHQDIR